MRYLTSYGAMWRVSERNYRKLLSDVLKGKDWHLDDYGKRICDATINVTDLDRSNVDEFLHEFRREPQQYDHIVNVP